MSVTGRLGPEVQVRGFGALVPACRVSAETLVT
jgi:hypothetical protein